MPVHICQTPEASFQSQTSDQAISMKVVFPGPLSLTEEEVIRMEDQMHDFFEAMLAPFWTRLETQTD